MTKREVVRPGLTEPELFATVTTEGWSPLTHSPQMCFTSSRMPMVKLLNLAKSRFPHLLNGDKTTLQGGCKQQDTSGVLCSAQRRAHPESMVIIIMCSATSLALAL